jgi:hypothetical protein
VTRQSIVSRGTRTGECGSVTEDQWIATGISQCPRDDNTLFATDESAAVHHGPVIARRERSEGRGNPSCLEGRVRRVRFVYRFTVDRHGLRPRDDNTWVVKIRESALPHGPVIARSDQREGRGNPSCPEGRVPRVGCSLTGSQWIATGYALAMTIRKSALLHGSVIARSDQREGRGNPSCLERRVRGCCPLNWFTVDRHGLTPSR